MESTRQSDEPARPNLLGGADEPIGASPPLLSVRADLIIPICHESTVNRPNRNTQYIPG